MLSGNWKKIQDSPTLIGGFKVRLDDQYFFPTPVLSGRQPFLSSQCEAHWSAFHKSVGAEGCDIVQEVGTSVDVHSTHVVNVAMIWGVCYSGQFVPVHTFLPRNSEPFC